MSTYRQFKTEHGGAKHAQGYWGTKAEAKQKSRKKRRQDAKKKTAYS